VTDEQTTILYTLSTLAQTCAALAAFVGAVGLFRLQAIRDQRRDLEREMRSLAPLMRQDFALTQPLQVVFEMVHKLVSSPATPEIEEKIRVFYLAVRDWWATGPLLHDSRRALFAFEGWNLFVIAVSLVGFNHVAWLASWEFTLWSLWPVAIITAAVTGWSVYAWTRG
jgi:hypothetical protein